MNIKRRLQLLKAALRWTWGFAKFDFERWMWRADQLYLLVTKEE